MTKIRPLVESGRDQLADFAALIGRTGSSIMRFVAKFRKDSRGATAIEYGLIAALIAVAAITAMTSLGNQLTTTFNNVSNNMKAG